jgi:hypothetical protein
MTKTIADRRSLEFIAESVRFIKPDYSINSTMLVSMVSMSCFFYGFKCEKVKKRETIEFNRYYHFKKFVTKLGLIKGAVAQILLTK